LKTVPNIFLISSFRTIAEGETGCSLAAIFLQKVEDEQEMLRGHEGSHEIEKTGASRKIDPNGGDPTRVCPKAVVQGSAERLHQTLPDSH